MEIKRLTINRHQYVFRNYGDGWDAYYYNGHKLEILEEGCSSFKAAYDIAAEHATKEV